VVPHVSKRKYGISVPNHTALTPEKEGNHLRSVPKQITTFEKLPNQPTQFATIEIEQTKQNATKPVAFSFCLTRRLAAHLAET
jgi:hypothetical protein